METEKKIEGAGESQQEFTALKSVVSRRDCESASSYH
jgi:hypothetical protein